jgi:chromosome segregation ATPase
MVNLASNEKIHELEEKLLKSKDEVIELQKKLVDQSQQVIKLNQQLKESNEDLSHKEAKYLEAENKIELLKHRLEDSENKIANYELAARAWHDEKVESEIQFNILLQKYDRLKEENQLLLNSQLKIREEQIERINRLNEQEELLRRNRMKEEIANACATTTVNDQKLTQSFLDP